MWLKIVSIALGISLGAGAAVAQSRCAERSELVTRFEQLFEEKLAGAGITFDGAMMELWASKNGSWTILVTRPDGRSCVLSHGRDWHLLATITGRVS